MHASSSSHVKAQSTYLLRRLPRCLQKHVNLDFPFTCCKLDSFRGSCRTESVRAFFIYLFILYANNKDADQSSILLIFECTICTYNTNMCFYIVSYHNHQRSLRKKNILFFVIKCVISLPSAYLAMVL